MAGDPLQNGLYAAVAGAVLYAIFGTCRQISMGPSSGLAAVAASAVATAGLTAPGDVATFVAGITLISGLLFLLLAILRMGWISQFLSRPWSPGSSSARRSMLSSGSSQRSPAPIPPARTRSRSSVPGWVLSARRTCRHLAVGVVSLVVVFGIRHVAPRVPGALVLVVGGLIASYLFDFGEKGVALVGDVPSGLPSFDIPSPSLLLDHGGTAIVAAVALMLIGFSRTAGDARLRGQAPLPDRREPRVGRSGRGQHRFGGVLRYARLDESVGQLPQRPLRGQDRARVDHQRCHRPADVAVPGAALLAASPSRSSGR